MTDYIINPIRMGGLVKEVDENQVKVHLHGRLGVITVPKRLVITSEELTPGHEMEFSKLQLNFLMWPRVKQ